MFSRSAEYGLRAMVHLVRQPEGKLVPVHEIAARIATPPFLTARVLQTLARAKLLQATKGHHGGYWLERDPEGITVAEVIQAIDGPIRVFDCEGMPTCRSFGECNLQFLFMRAQRALDDVLGATTIGELAGPRPEAGIRSKCDCTFGKV